MYNITCLPLVLLLPLAQDKDPLRVDVYQQADSLQAGGLATTGFTQMRFADESSFNILAVPGERLIAETLKGHWRCISMAGLLDGQCAKSLDLACVFLETHRVPPGNVSMCWIGAQGRGQHVSTKVRNNGGWLTTGAAHPSGNYDVRLCVEYLWQHGIIEEAQRIQVLTLSGLGWAVRLPLWRFVLKCVGCQNCAVS